MHRALYFRIAIFLSFAGILLFASCTKNADLNIKTDKLKLTALIDSANQLYNNAIEGTKPGLYAPGSKEKLKLTLDQAVMVNTGDKFIQQEVENVFSNLINALLEFNAGLMQEVRLANLVAYWKLDGNAIDASGHDHTGMLKTGWVGTSAANATDGGTLPQAVPDRFNRPGLAYSFTNAAHIEVPYAASLNPKSFTISLWLKRQSTSDNNYVFSLNRWNGYKLQVQNNTFLHMSFKADNGYQDMESNPGSIQQNVWTFVAISYTTGTMKFYIDNVLVKTAAVTGIPVTQPTPVNLAIGNELPKSVYNLSEPNGPFGFSGAHFFTGSLDEMRLYNAALTDAEVLAIYTIEKTL